MAIENMPLLQLEKMAKHGVAAAKSELAKRDTHVDELPWDALERRVKNGSLYAQREMERRAQQAKIDESGLDCERCGEDFPADELRLFAGDLYLCPTCWDAYRIVTTPRRQ